MITITRIRPTPPLGPYPQFLLYGQLGIAPSSKRIKIITRIVTIANTSVRDCLEMGAEKAQVVGDGRR